MRKKKFASQAGTGKEKAASLPIYQFYYADFDISKRWFFHAKIEGKRKKVYGGINNIYTKPGRLAAAARLLERLNPTQELKQIIGSAINSKAIKRAKALPLLPLIDEFLRYQKEVEKLKPKTLSGYTGILKAYHAYLIADNMGGFKPDLLHSNHAEEYMEHLRRKYSNSHCNKHLVQLRNFWNYLIRKKHVKQNPFEDMKALKRNSVSYQYYQPHQVRRLKKYMVEHEPQLWFFVEFVAYAFIRPGELRQLKVSDIYWEEGKILIRKEVAKNKKQQFVPMCGFLKKKIMANGVLEYAPKCYVFGKNGEPGEQMLGANTMASRHRVVLKKMGFDTKYYKLYSWKHTGAIRMVNAGMNLKYLQIMLRHHSLDMVDVYLQKLGHVRKEELNKIPELS